MQKDKWWDAIESVNPALRELKLHHEHQIPEIFSKRRLEQTPNHVLETVVIFWQKGFEGPDYLAIH